MLDHPKQALKRDPTRCTVLFESRGDLSSEYIVVLLDPYLAPHNVEIAKDDDETRGGEEIPAAPSVPMVGGPGCLPLVEPLAVSIHLESEVGLARGEGIHSLPPSGTPTAVGSNPTVGVCLVVLVPCPLSGDRRRRVSCGTTPRGGDPWGDEARGAGSTQHPPVEARPRNLDAKRQRYGVGSSSCMGAWG